MKKNILTILSFLVTCLIYAQSDKYVVLISIDGFRPDFYLEEEWPAPNLKEMAEQGTKALGVRGVFPSVTYPSHTTLITGDKPYNHGIYYNAPFEPEVQTGKWYWEADLIKSQTLWQAVRDANLTSASFFWPVSVGAPIDYNIPEVWSLDKNSKFMAENRKNENPKGFLAELEKAATGVLTEHNFNGDYLNREDRTGEMAAYTLETYKPNFMSIHLIATDHFQHSEGKKGATVYKALAATDRAIGKIREAAQRANIDDKLTIIVTGDHGFVDIHSSISPNIWLKDLGLLDDSKNSGNWKAIFHTSGASAFLILKNPDDTKTLNMVKDKLNSLPKNIQKLFRVVSKEELQTEGSSKEAVLALAPIPGVAMSGSTKGDIIQPRKGGTHGYFPNFKAIETGFVAWGAGIQKSKTIETMNIEDIAPIVAEILEVNFTPKDGVLYPGILKD
ncbi:alkaline phosphatase family protein [Joostella sp. CR20]|uniref:alkaline phosphatase family protein n=1 Tax=Joostella sp. CR20 TaxID=2804312 RepID=UPI00313AF102